MRNPNVIKEPNGDIVFRFIIYVIIAALTIVCFYPFWDLLVLSLMDPVEAYKGGFHLIPKSFNLGAYRQVLSSPDVWLATYNSVWRVVVGSLLSVLLTTLVAYPLSKRYEFPLYKFWMTYVVITMYFSGGMIPQYLTYRSMGLINNRLVLVLPGAISAYNLIMTRNYLRTIPTSLEEAARIDGASEFTIWSRIILPLSVPIMVTVGLWTAVGQWNAFMDVLIYITDRSKYVLQIILRRMIVDNEVSTYMDASKINMEVTPPDEQVKAAFTMVCTIPIVMLYPFAQKYFIKGITVGAEKG